MPKRYVLNSAVITSPGLYTYDLIDVKWAKRWLEEGDFESTIGYEETAEALKRLTGIEVPVNRKTIKMERGDEALVFRLAFKPGDPRPSAALKGNVGVDWLIERAEFGLLRKAI